MKRMLGGRPAGEAASEQPPARSAAARARVVFIKRSFDGGGESAGAFWLPHQNHTPVLSPRSKRTGLKCIREVGPAFAHGRVRTATPYIRLRPVVPETRGGPSTTWPAAGTVRRQTEHVR